MKTTNKHLTALLLTGMISSAQAVDLLLEGFETDGNGSRYIASTPFNDGGSDHWNRTDGSDISNTTAPYSNYQGSYFWAAEDVNDNGGNGMTPQTLLFEDININAYNNLAFSGLFGAGNGPGATNYDAADFVKIQYRIDGSGNDTYTDGVCFAYQDNGDDFNEPFGLDADCNGVADEPLLEMIPAMASYGFTIPTTGYTIDLLVSVSVDAGSEEFGFDQLLLTGDDTGVDTLPVVLATNPADQAIDVELNSNIQITFSEAVDVGVNAVTVDCTQSGIQIFGEMFDVSSIDLATSDFISTDVCTVTLDASVINDRDGTFNQLDGDRDGNAGGDYVFSFTAVPDTAPEVSSTDPTDGSVGLQIDDNLIVNFSESIDATANAATLVCSQSGAVSLSGVQVDDVAVMTIDPDSNLIDLETCDLTLLAAEIFDNDLTQDNMVADVVISFMVGYPVVEIFDIQGDGLASPYHLSTVTTLDNIVTALDSNGFYMQTPDARNDSNPLTSSGIYVFTGGAPAVSVGDQVDLTGDIEEFFDLTEFTNPGSYVLTVDASNQPLPAAIILDANFPYTDPTVFPCGIESLGYECFEGMLFDMPAGVVSAASAGFFGSDINDIVVNAGSQRAMREPGIEYPDSLAYPGLPEFDGNPELIEMSVEALTLPFQTLAAGTKISAKGVISYGFGDYELQPSELIVIEENVIPKPVRDAVADEVTIGSANLYRFFDPIDDPGEEDDDQIEDPAVYANRLVKLAKYVVNDLKSPTLIGLQEVENLNVLNELITAISAEGGPTYTASLIDGNDRGGIDVAYLYQAALLSNVVITQYGAAEINTFDSSLLHDRPPLRLKATADLSNGGTLDLNVLVVHMRSRGSIDSASDGERVRSKRLQQANSVAAMIDVILTEDPLVGLYVIGDFNAFQFTDGYVDVVGQITGQAIAADNLLWDEPLFVNAPLTQAVQTLVAEDQYSFVFSGIAQILDNAIMNDIGLMNMTGFQFVRGQADANIDLESNNTSVRSSDHDGFVIFVQEDNDLIFSHGFE
ncbi:Ig-like domain-containing protein [Marinicella litoralis]|uniref:Putative extracellular nuclease n=1 Tax=Marinicella litoralis TaxID=644220 RepID=A0A4R6XRS3_9GAMM|nr:Ig-like domain-containing protein [Marinicella litoralis]TDR20617.1 putative extracellular nuclease [Marinicella litoralis]